MFPASYLICMIFGFLWRVLFKNIYNLRQKHSRWWNCVFSWKVELIVSGHSKYTSWLAVFTDTCRKKENLHIVFQNLALSTLTVNLSLIITGFIHFRKCCRRQKGCQRNFATEAWIKEGWATVGWNYHSINSPERNSPNKACNLENLGTQRTGCFLYFSYEIVLLIYDVKKRCCSLCWFMTWEILI